MSFSRERAVWLGRNVFPHEAALRQWLSARTASAGLEVDDVVQETYAILASIERVDHIRNARTYMFEVAKSVVLQSLRRARIVTIDVQANAQFLDIPEDARRLKGSLRTARNCRKSPRPLPPCPTAAAKSSRCARSRA